MKKLFVSIYSVFLMSAFTAHIQAQTYQLPNSNFETWSGTATNAEPVNWNSFATADCTIGGFMGLIACPSAKTPHHYKVAGHRTGGIGSYYLTVYSTSILGVTANGNMTLGQIRVGSTTANSSSNFNYTKRSDTAFSEAFTASPDSIYVWTKFWAASASDQARISTIIHGNTDFKDPNDASTASAYAGKAISQFTRTGTSASTCTWVQQKIPFIYNGNSTRNYILITFTNNSSPGGGNAGDSLSIDDIELIYSAWVTDIKLNSISISGFNTATFNYDILYPRGTNPNNFPAVSYTTEVSDVTDTVITYPGVNNGLDSARSVITVLAEDGVTQKVYTINYSIWKSNDSTLSNIGYTLSGTDTVQVPSFLSTQQTYNVSLAPGTVATPFINYLTLSDTGARVIQITQATSPNGQAIIKVRAENGMTATYTVNFSVQLSTNAKLDSLKYNGIQVAGFHPDTLSYQILLNPGTTIVPFVTAKTQWGGLTPSITQASSLPGTASVVVTAEDGTTIRTYTIVFKVALSTNDSAAWIKYNAIALGDFHPDTLHYNVVLPYGTSSVNLTSAAVWSTAQISITNPSSFPGIGKVKITAEDTNHTRTYSINFSVAKNPNALLDSIAYQHNSIHYALIGFVDTIYSYTIVFPPKTKQIPVVSAWAQNGNAHVSIDQPSSPNDTAIIHVLAEDSFHTKTYYLIFKVKLDTNATLSLLKMNDSLVNGFNASILTYNVALDSAAMPIFTATTSDTAARFSIVYPALLPGVVTITVKAEDTTVSKVYRIYLSIKSSDNADLLDLGYTLNNIHYAISGFHKDTLIYHVLLPLLTSYTPIVTLQKAVRSSTFSVIQPISPNDTGIVVVTSANDSIIKTYSIFFEVALSTNDSAAWIKYNAVTVANYHPDTLQYNVVLPYGTSSVNLTSAAVWSTAQISITNPSSFPGIGKVKITAEDTNHTRTYSINFSVAKNPNALLDSIAYQHNSIHYALIGFVDTTYVYTIVFPPKTKQIPVVSAWAQNGNAHVSIDQPSSPNDTAIIHVLAEDSFHTKTYYLIFKVKLDTNATLSSLKMNDSLVNGFNASVLTYNIALDSVAMPIFTATTSDTAARLSIVYPALLPGVVTITVKAEDTTVSQIYKIYLTIKSSNNADLLDLGYTLNNIQHAISGFHKDTLNYHVFLPPLTSYTPIVTLQKAVPSSTVFLTQPISPNDTGIVVVTSANDSIIKTYSIFFKVALSTNDSAAWIKYNAIALGDFHPDTLHYNVVLPYGTSSVNLTSVAAWSTAQVSVTNPSSFPGIGTVKITAEDTNHARTYSINFSVAKNPNALLDSIAYQHNSIHYALVGFSDTIYSYTIVFPPKTKQVPVVSAWAQDGNAHVSIDQPSSPNDTAIIHVLAEDSIHTKTYYLIFNVKLDTNATLSSLKMNDSLVNGFNASVLTYNVALDSAAMPIFTATTSDTAARLSIVYPALLPGVVTITVKAEDTTVSKVYRIYLSIKSSDNADLLDVGYTLNNIHYAISNFHKDTLIYHVLLPSLTSYTPIVTWQKAVPGSTVSLTQPISPNDTGIIVVTSANDSIIKTYYVFFKVEISTNAALSSIAVNGNNLAAFHADSSYYHVYLHYDSLVPPVISATAQSAAAHITIHQAATLNDSARVIVLAEDSVHMRTYIVHFTRQLSPRATLNSLGYKLGSADSVVNGFASNVFTYTVNLKAETVQIPSLITYMLTDSRASVQLVHSPLHVNDTAIIKVKAENLVDSNMYVVIFNRLPSANVNLDTLYINGNSLQSFHKDSLQYSIILPWGTSQIPFVTASAAWNVSTINITQAGTYFGQAQVQVIAEDGVHTRTYFIQFVQGSNVDLQSLSYNLSGNNYSISTFNAADTVYHIMLPIATTDIPTLTYSLVDSRCVVDTIPTLASNGEISLIIKGWDGLHMKTYKVEFEVILSTDAHLTDLTIDSVTIAGFHADTIFYQVEYPYGTVNLPLVEAVALEPDAQITITQITTFPGTATVVVKAGDTTVSMTYQIYFSIEPGDNAYLSELNVNDTLIANFDKSTYLYEYSLPYGSSVVPVISAMSEDSRASVSILQAVTFQDTAWVTVTAVNGVDSLNYGVVFVVGLSNDTRLSWIKIDGVLLSTFSSELSNYKYLFNIDYKKIPVVTAGTKDSKAVCIITPPTALPGQTKIDVIAEDGISMRTYRVNFLYVNSIEVVDANYKLVIYPNPTHDIVKIKLEGEPDCLLEIQLYDVFGKRLKSQFSNENPVTLDMSNFPEGMYILKINRENKPIKSVKLIKY